MNEAGRDYLLIQEPEGIMHTIILGKCILLNHLLGPSDCHTAAKCVALATAIMFSYCKYHALPSVE